MAAAELITSGLPIIGSVLNSQFAMHQQREQNAYNERMLDKQNNYNSPSATLARMVAAGIPLKAAQRSLAGVPSVGAQPTANTATPYTGSEPFAGFGEAANLYAQASLAKSQARLNNATAEGQELDNSNKPQAYEDAHQQALAIVRNYNAQSDKSLSEKDLIDLQQYTQKLINDEQEIRLENLPDEISLQLDKIALDYNVEANDLAFAIASFNSRLDNINLSNSKLTSEQQEIITTIRQIQQVINTNEPEELKAQNIAKIRKAHPDTFKYFDAISGAKPRLLKRFLQSLTKSGAFTK